MVCLDTTIVVDFLQGRISADFLDSFNEDASIASPTIMEIFRGLNLKKNIINIKKDEREKINYLLDNLSVLVFDNYTAKLAGEIEAELLNKGDFVGPIDIMIATIAIKNNETLVTRNKKHFDKIPNLKVIGY